MALLQIPGNIKQQYQPFVLDPKAAINQKCETSPELNNMKSGTIGPQVFTFRSPTVYGKTRHSPGGVGHINICPSSFRSWMNMDVSMLSLYADSMLNQSLTYQAIFDALPGIQIREYLPDTLLDQCINMFNDIMTRVKEIWSEEKDKNKVKRIDSYGQKDTGNGRPASEREKVRLNPDERRDIANSVEKSLFDKLKAVLSDLGDYLCGRTSDGESILDAMKVKGPTSSYMSSTAAGNGYGKDKLVLDIPYVLYYRLLSSTTTNVYELPCALTSKTMYASDGSKGWGAGTIALHGDDGKSFLSKIPFVGDMLNSMLGNIRINYMPVWNSKDGYKTAHPAIEVKFDLFNDTQKAAMLNYIFVLTLTGGAKWIQYGFVQQSPDLYDIKLEGFDRLYCCSGNFTVTYDGVLRDPSLGFLTYMVNKYANSSDGKLGAGNIDKKKFLDNIVKNKLIKIPDVYHVTMKFESLLPDNFNNLLYTISENNDVIESPRKGVDKSYSEHVYDSSAAADAISGGIEGAVKRIRKKIVQMAADETNEYNAAVKAALKKKGATHTATGDKL